MGRVQKGGMLCPVPKHLWNFYQYKRNVYNDLLWIDFFSLVYIGGRRDHDSWSFGCWIYNYLRYQCLSPLKLWVRISFKRGVLDTTLCDKVWQWLAADRWFSPGTPVSSTNKTDRHDITETLLKVALNTINQTKSKYTDIHWYYWQLFG